MDTEVKKLECPFTWNIEKNLIDGCDGEENLSVDANEEPLYAFITSMIKTYFGAVKNNPKIVEKLKTLDDCWEKLDKNMLNNIEVSSKVLFHIKEATKYYVYKLTNYETEADKIFKNLEDAGNFCSPSELATIDGCKSVLWSSFHGDARHEITKSAKLAIAGSRNCPLWYYILSKGLRHERYVDYGIGHPSAEEESSILRSLQLSDTPFYKIRLAQMYREQKKDDEAKIVYSEIYDADPQGQEILLKLARAFIGFRELEKAEMCLGKAAGYSNSTFYHHCKGIFYIKNKKYKMAAAHFKKAAKRGYDYRSDLLYAWCSYKINHNFHYVAHLESMVEKYSKTTKFKQQTLLHIAMHYYYQKDDCKSTLIYLLKAIEFDPNSEQLKDYTNTTINWKRFNIYDFTQRRQQEYQDQAELTEEMQGTLEKLRDYCQEFYKSNDP